MKLDAETTLEGFGWRITRWRVARVTRRLVLILAHGERIAEGEQTVEKRLRLYDELRARIVEASQDDEFNELWLDYLLGDDTAGPAPALAEYEGPEQ